MVETGLIYRHLLALQCPYCGGSNIITSMLEKQDGTSGYYIMETNSSQTDCAGCSRHFNYQIRDLHVTQ